jgi:pimeloyl-ACP methyl ester carboxylesterase
MVVNSQLPEILLFGIAGLGLTTMRWKTTVNLDFFRKGWLSGITLMAVALVTLDARSADTSTQQITDPAYAHAHRLITVEPGRRMNIFCIGHGRPVVIFDAGMNNWSQIWGLVQPAVAKRTRACVYDRAGMGFSDPSVHPGDSAHIVRDLHQLLNAAGIAPSYVLVGHSYGAMNVRLYAHKYPAETAGLVLVDPSHEDAHERGFQLYEKVNSKVLDPIVRAEMLANEGAQEQKDRDGKLACLQAAIKGLKPGTPDYAACVSPGNNPHYSAAINAVYTRLQTQPGYRRACLSEETSFSYASADELKAARMPFGNLPVIVLTRSPDACTSSDERGMCEGWNTLWNTLHDELAQLSSRGVNRVIPHTSHDIHMDNPQAVIDGINEVVDMARVDAL